MIKYHSIIIKIKEFIDRFTVLSKTCILFSVKTGERLHYTRYTSHGFNVLVNSVYRHTARRLLFNPECVCV
jgi:hypothetical protein